MKRILLAVLPLAALAAALLTPRAATPVNAAELVVNTLMEKGRTKTPSSVESRALPWRMEAHVVNQDETSVTLRIVAERRPRGVARPQCILVRVPDTGAVESYIDGVAREAVEAGRPAIMRDVRVVRLRFTSPFLSGSARADTTSFIVSLRTAGGAGENEIRGHERPRSPAFHRLYRQLLINYDDPPPDETGVIENGEDGARYLFIVPDEYVEDIVPLFESKEARGLLPRIVTVEEAGGSLEAIRGYIESAYDEWAVPPEFVLLCGDRQEVPAQNNGEFYTDNCYAAIDGDDYLADVMIGRFPGRASSQLVTMVSKTLIYDSPWTTPDSSWLTSGLLMVQDDYDPGDEIYYDDTEHLESLMRAAGFAPVDTLFSKNGVTLEQTIAAVEDGRGYLNYRGCCGGYWWGEFMVIPPDLLNEWRLPVVVSGTCLTGDYIEDFFMGKSWVRAGSAADPRGAAAFFGTGTAGQGEELSLRRSAVDQGFFSSVFSGSRTLGEACLAGKMQLYTTFDDQEEYEGWNLFGDPELTAWTAEPGEMSVDYSPAVIAGQSNDVTVDVRRLGEPVPGATVSCRADSGLYAWGLTDSLGRASLELMPHEPGTLRVAVLAKDARPFSGTLLSVSAGAFVYPADQNVCDSAGGNGDDLLSPGESFTLQVALRNIGTADAGSVTATLRIRNPHVALRESLMSYGTIGVGTETWGVGSFEARVSDDWPGGGPIGARLAIDWPDGANVAALQPLETVTGLLAFEDVWVDDSPPSGDGDGSPEPGETVALTVALRNRAGEALSNVAGTLSSQDAAVAVLSDEASFPDAAPDSLVCNDGSPLLVSFRPDAPESHRAKLLLRASAGTQSYAYAESLDVTLTLETDAGCYPSGPDNYGYYAYDSGDTLFTECPRYSWMDIVPPGPGTRLDHVSTHDDATEHFWIDSLSVVYYGEQEALTSVASNGLCILDYLLGGATGTNSRIPSKSGPRPMVAAFWDDLDPEEGGDVYFWKDAEGHRMVIQWENVRHGGAEATETFQTIVYDAGHYPTPTGDSPILFQYRNVGDASSCTVGIEDYSEREGLQYLFNGLYAPNAATLDDCTSVLFTTSPPVFVELPWLVTGQVSVDDAAGGDGDGVLEPGETASVSVVLENRGRGGSCPVSASLACESDNMVVIDGVATYEAVPPGESCAPDSGGFVVAVDADAEPGSAQASLELDGESLGPQRGLRFGLPIGVPAGTAAAFGLTACYPNPSSLGTTVAVALPEPRRVTARVYTVAGRVVATFCDDVLESGVHPVTWDGRDADGRLSASGVYFIRVTAGDESRTMKAVLLR